MTIGSDPLSTLPLSTIGSGSSTVLPLLRPRLRAIAGADAIDLSWTVSRPEIKRKFYLRRSTTAFPTAPDQGELVLTTLDYAFRDTNVETNVVYFYTVFVAFDDPPTRYEDHLPEASDSAKVSMITTAEAVIEEYVPKRGEFGRAVSPPVAKRTSGVWGDLANRKRRDSDVIAVVAADAILAPVSGVVTAIENDVGDLKTVVIDSQVGGFRFTVGPFKPLAGMTIGSRVTAAMVMGRAAHNNLHLAIVKLPTGRYGQRTVRPSYFYLTLEARDGRREG